MDRLQAHRGHATGCDVKARCECDDVKFVDFSIGSLNAVLDELFDLDAALFGDVYDLDVVGIQNLIVVLLKARTL